jgi:hypothetical protein
VAVGQQSENLTGKGHKLVAFLLRTVLRLEAGFRACQETPARNLR